MFSQMKFLRFIFFFAIVIYAMSDTVHKKEEPVISLGLSNEKVVESIEWADRMRMLMCGPRDENGRPLMIHPPPTAPPSSEPYPSPDPIPSGINVPDLPQFPPSNY